MCIEVVEPLSNRMEYKPLRFSRYGPAFLLALCLEHQLILLHSKFHMAIISPWYYQSHSDILHEQALSFLTVCFLTSF